SQPPELNNNPTPTAESSGSVILNFLITTSLPSWNSRRARYYELRDAPKIMAERAGFEPAVAV
ncbi:MAG: hypothetical protein V3W11_01160, partial [bacterium]